MSSIRIRTDHNVILMRAQRAEDLLLCHAVTTEPRQNRSSGGYAAIRMTEGYGNSFLYSPYPSASSLSTGMNRIDAEFMQ